MRPVFHASKKSTTWRPFPSFIYVDFWPVRETVVPDLGIRHPDKCSSSAQTPLAASRPVWPPRNLYCARHFHVDFGVECTLYDPGQSVTRPPIRTATNVANRLIHEFSSKTNWIFPYRSRRCSRGPALASVYGRDSFGERHAPSTHFGLKNVTRVMPQYDEI